MGNQTTKPKDKEPPPPPPRPALFGTDALAARFAASSKTKRRAFIRGEHAIHPQVMGVTNAAIGACVEAVADFPALVTTATLPTVSLLPDGRLRTGAVPGELDTPLVVLDASASALRWCLTDVVDPARALTLPSGMPCPEVRVHVSARTMAGSDVPYFLHRCRDLVSKATTAMGFLRTENAVLGSIKRADPGFAGLRTATLTENPAFPRDGFKEVEHIGVTPASSTYAFRMSWIHDDHRDVGFVLSAALSDGKSPFYVDLLRVVATVDAAPADLCRVHDGRVAKVMPSPAACLAALSKKKDALSVALSGCLIGASKKPDA